mgnify:CR=1 FL=1
MRTTFPHLLLQHAAERPDAPALREKEYGIWQTWSWADTARTVRHMACGLAALGLQRGQNLALISDNRPHLYMGFVAAQALGAVPVPLYQDAVAAEMVFVVQDAEISIAFAENQEQVDKLLEVRESVPSIRYIVYDDPRGMRNYDQPGLISMEQLLEKGQAWDKAHPQAWDAMLGAIQESDVSVILYTSGTTGKPKGAMHLHKGLVYAVRGYNTNAKMNPPLRSREDRDALIEGRLGEVPGPRRRAGGPLRPGGRAGPKAPRRAGDPRHLRAPTGRTGRWTGSAAAYVVSSGMRNRSASRPWFDKLRDFTRTPLRLPWNDANNSSPGLPPNFPAAPSKSPPPAPTPASGATSVSASPTIRPR